MRIVAAVVAATTAVPPAVTAVTFLKEHEILIIMKILKIIFVQESKHE